MRTTTQYLDAAKAALGISSDYALAKHLELTQQAVSKLRRGAIMSNTTAVRLAEILELEPLQVIADAELERGTNDALWRRIRDVAAFSFGLVGVAVLYFALVGDLTIINLAIVPAALTHAIADASAIHIVQQCCTGKARQ